MAAVCPQCDVFYTLEEDSSSTTCPSCGLPLVSKPKNHRDQVAESAEMFGETVDLPGEIVDGGNVKSREVSLPTSLGRYEILGLLGSGGFANVYRALDTQLRRTVAIKVPRADRFDQQSDLSFFLQEAIATAELEHPHIISVYDVGEGPANLRYIVMQYISGASLQEHLLKRRFTYRQTAELIRKVALAIHHAHRHGFFHRDLKPGNILLDAVGDPHVADFGMAVRHADQYSHAGEIAGTLRYMAPEQVRGDVHRLDGRTDIWSLGGIMYRMLTGAYPFVGESSQLADEILHRDPRPPRQIDHQIPPVLERICLKCLVKDPSHRYGNAFDVAEELQAWLASTVAGATITAPANAASEPLPEKTGRSSRRFLVVATVVVLALVAWFVAWRSGDPAGANSGGKFSLEPHRQAKLDDVAVVKNWHVLLNRPPRELIWGTNGGDARWHYDPNLQDLMIDTPHLTLLQLEETAAKSFRLQVTITKTAWTGSAGLFWGYRVPPSDAADASPSCDIMWLYSFNDQGTNRLRLQWETVTFPQANEVPYPQLRRERRWAEEIPLAIEREGILEIQIADGQLSRVMWKGQYINGFVGQFAEVRSSGIFGVADERGAVVFRDARIMLLEK